MSGSRYISDILRAQKDDFIQCFPYINLFPAVHHNIDIVCHILILFIYFLKWMKSYFIDLSLI